MVIPQLLDENQSPFFIIFYNFIIFFIIYRATNVQIPNFEKTRFVVSFGIQKSGCILT